jgi:hypothetical protein
MANSNADAWIQAVRKRFGLAGECPLIDDAAIVDDGVLYDLWPWVLHSRRRKNKLVYEADCLAGCWRRSSSMDVAVPQPSG